MTPPSLAVTVDVEGVVEEGNFGSVATLDAFLAEVGVPATLFVTPAVIRERTEAVRGWIEGPHAVGLHLHPGRFGGDSDWLASYERHEIESFLERGKAVFEERFDEEPRLFRAGRWSFSERLLVALDASGFEIDASHRPDGRRAPYAYGGLTEYPMTVLSNPALRLLLRPTGVDGFALHTDAFLRNRPGTAALYTATGIAAASGRPYLMVSFHDYDLVDDARRRRTKTYLGRLAARCRPRTVPELSPDDSEVP
jgi:peptidoglycan/xylan/chitin deacetylase (PgdA/CDA1 family)